MINESHNVCGSGYLIKVKISRLFLFVMFLIFYVPRSTEIQIFVIIAFEKVYFYS